MALEWEAFALSIWPDALKRAAIEPASLRDHAEDILRATAMDMVSRQSTQQQSDKSKGRGHTGVSSAAINQASVEHATRRVADGFEMGAVIAEYRALRASVLRLWGESASTPDHSDLVDVTRFNESIDQSLTEAVRAYTHEIVRDRETLLTNERSARAAAEKASAAKDQFLARLSHELRTPLTPVLMTVIALEATSGLEPGLREDIEMIRRNVELEVALIDDLLDVSRITSGKLLLRLETVDWNQAVRDAGRICEVQMREKGIHLHYALSDDCGAVNADPARLQQVLWNLMRNAAKFTPEGGEIFIATVCHSDGTVEVSVRDTGIGIPSDVLGNIFDAFEQGDVSITHQFGGMGLGLAISRSLVELHGGTIRAESPGAGKGATFHVQLRSFPAPPVAPRGRASDLPIGRPMRILLAEDHADTALMLRRLLSQSGHTVRIAGSVVEALEMAGREPFDLLLSDLGLPDASGYELMRQIKSRHGLRGIAMSGYGTDEDIRRGEEAGFSDHMVKPVSLEQLKRAIARLSGLATSRGGSG